MMFGRESSKAELLPCARGDLVMAVLLIFTILYYEYGFPHLSGCCLEVSGALRRLRALEGWCFLRENFVMFLTDLAFRTSPPSRALGTITSTLVTRDLEVVECYLFILP